MFISEMASKVGCFIGFCPHCLVTTSAHTNIPCNMILICINKTNHTGAFDTFCMHIGWYYIFHTLPNNAG